MPVAMLTSRAVNGLCAAGPPVDPGPRIILASSPVCFLSTLLLQRSGTKEGRKSLGWDAQPLQCTQRTRSLEMGAAHLGGTRPRSNASPPDLGCCSSVGYCSWRPHLWPLDRHLYKCRAILEIGFPFSRYAAITRTSHGRKICPPVPVTALWLLH
ncbi:hypothetical protein MRX96_009821 [Rhipicephalus microplus]